MTRARDLAAFVSNADGDIKFDTDTLFIDSSANRVGIGTTSPTELLTVRGAAHFGKTAIETSADTPVIIKSDTDHQALHIEENSGAESWQIGVNANGDLNFHDSGSATPTLSLIDGAYINIAAQGRLGTNSTNPIAYTGSSSGNAGIGSYNANTDFNIYSAGTGDIKFRTGAVWSSTTSGLTNTGTERMRIDGDTLLFGKTSSSSTSDGCELRDGQSGYTATFTADSANTTAVISLVHNNTTLPQKWIDFRSGTLVKGVIGCSTETSSTGMWLGFGDTGFSFQAEADNSITPVNANTGVTRDNAVDLGSSGARFDDIHATNGTIQTSDEREKQNIASITDAEMTAAKAISKLFKTFKWKDKVAAKGDAARTHTGVIAQQVETAMSDAGLNAGDYAFFISTTWWETQTEVAAVEAVEAQDAVYEDVIIPAVEEVLDEEGNVVTEAQPERTEQRLVSKAIEGIEGQEAYTHITRYSTLEEAPEGATERNRKGIRYPELLSFIGAATEQRLTSIEARLDALEA